MKAIEKQIEDFNAWLVQLPEGLRAVAEKYPMYECYRSTRNAGHYKIMSYTTPKGEMLPVHVTIAHGTDSYLPGVATYDQPPEQLILCGCGEWAWPTPEQIQQTRAELSSRVHDCGDPRCHLGANHDG